MTSAAAIPIEVEAIRRSTNLEQLVAVVKRGMATTIEVAEALLRIHDTKLYTMTARTWETFCLGIGVEPRRSYQLMEFARVRTTVQADVPNERVARELAKVPEEQRPAVLAEATEAAGDGPVTSALIREAAEPRSPLLAREAYGLSESNEHYTPAPFVDAARATMGGIDLDPASCAEANATVQATEIFTIEDNGLRKRWHGRVWENCPYGWINDETHEPWDSSGPGKCVASAPLWLKKTIEEYEAGHIEQACALFNATPGDEWWQALWDRPLCFPRRIAFIVPGGKPQVGNLRPSVIAYFGPHEDRFVEHFAPLGRIVVPRGSLSVSLSAGATS